MKTAGTWTTTPLVAILAAASPPIQAVILLHSANIAGRIWIRIIVALATIILSTLLFILLEPPVPLLINLISNL